MMVFYKPNIQFIVDHAVDPDKRRYMIPDEGPRHYIDLDHYGTYPFDSLPRSWIAAANKFGDDSLKNHGIVPWWTVIMLQRLTNAFKEKNKSKILKLSAEIGHYIADAHVPLHTSSNHNGQLTNQIGIHGFWESRVPELLADDEFDFFIGKALYISNPSQFIWQRVLESAKSVDSVLSIEKSLTTEFGAEQKYAFENRNGKIVRQYSNLFTRTYNMKLLGMVERRMRASIFAVASFWYTAWVNAGRPTLSTLTGKEFSAEDLLEFEDLDRAWNTGKIIGRTCDN